MQNFGVLTRCLLAVACTLMLTIARAATTPAPTVTISTSPDQILNGGHTLLSWSSSNATSCVSSGSWGGPRALSGADTTPALTSSQVYMLTCTGPGGSTKSKATVTVYDPPTVTIATNPSKITTGGHTLLSWSSTNATACVSSGSWGGPRALSGADTTPALTITKVYTLTCTNPGGGSATSTATVTVYDPPTVTIATNPSSITSGGHTLLSWSSTNATACVSSGSWGGPRALNGADTTPALTSNKVYRLTCTNPGGSATSTATVTVYDPPTVTIATSPSKVTSGGHTQLTWSTTNATSCVSSGSWGGPRALSGSDTTPALTSDKVYALTCTGPGGTASQSASVTVVAETGTAILSWTPPTTNTNGTPVVPLAGYHIYYQNSASGSVQSVPVSGGQTTSFEISGLGQGTWYFDVAADAKDGTEGPPSAIGSITF